jgi:DNA-binding MarR family transcriptional regulator
MAKAPPTPWLTPAELAAWKALVMMSEFLHQGLDRQLQRDSQMPHAYYGLLVALSEAPRRTLSMSDLARTADMSASRLSHAIKRMEEWEWVERFPSTDSGRVTMCLVTAGGMKALKAAAPGHLAFVRSVVFDHLDARQVGQLGDIASRIQAALVAVRDNSESNEV